MALSSGKEGVAKGSTPTAFYYVFNCSQSHKATKERRKGERRENNRRAFFGFLCLFLVEVLIAQYVLDRIIRPYFGDVLVVPLIYYFVRAFADVKPRPGIIGVTIFIFIVEGLQYLHFVHLIGLGHSRFWVTVIGNSFNWPDLVSYVTEH